MGRREQKDMTTIYIKERVQPCPRTRKELHAHPYLA
ncbi:hypothetical protein BDA96_04G111900 [Sorghum bicolor]|uniref:Uncharacterized protein n=2 Tax=Sorghum bicolor TaxID=4558 RepID=A0A921R211_SORBI|nr:hypothetical protein BDA96_04G111900 [Sorghum bicolor]OQU84686.1 hypothetical protein SORBI_3004G103450 [Sorghum bicolor]